MELPEMKVLKRKRKSNYSVRETEVLISEIRRRSDVLFSRQQNTAVNELKRRAWAEVAKAVTALGEGEVRTADEVKRRYLDWRTLTKRKQLAGALFLCRTPENKHSLSGEPSQEPSSYHREPQTEWQDLQEFENAVHCGVKLEEAEASGYNLEGGVCDGGPGDAEGEVDEDDEDCFPSILPDIDRDDNIPEDYAHIDEFGVLSCSKSAAALPLARDTPGTPGTPGGGGAPGESSGLLVALERQRLELERQRLELERERLQVEKKRLCYAELERERLLLERERLELERERLRLLSQQSAPLQQSPASSTTVTTPTTCPAPSSSSFPDVEKDRKPSWPMFPDLEAEKLKLEKERLLLEKERLQFFRFESGRLQIERERLQVEKERLQLQKDGQQMELHS